MNDPRSISYDQKEILDWVRELHCPNGFDVDMNNVRTFDEWVKGGL